MTRATAYAHTNIALIKYWGKRDGALNLPAVGSLSLTLDKFGTQTEVEIGSPDDQFTLDGKDASDDDAKKVFRFLDVVAGTERARARVWSRNDVPTAAGLASSASGFAALAVAAAKAYGKNVDDGRFLSQLARRGSGSAARSIFGAFVLMHKGHKDDGSDCFAEPMTTSLEARLVVARCAVGKKHTESTRGMESTARTSPYFDAWVDTHDADLASARESIGRGDIEALGVCMERNTMKMHASALAAHPWILYMNGATLHVLDEVRALRRSGTACWATMDAGPHVKILCAPANADAVAAACRSVDGVVGVDVCAPGPAAKIVSTS